jgi:hypothetical protein
MSDDYDYDESDNQRGGKVDSIEVKRGVSIGLLDGLLDGSSHGSLLGSNLLFLFLIDDCCKQLPTR